MTEDRAMFCDTCTKEGHGRIMSEAEALIHRDNHPDHCVVSANEEVLVEED